MNRNLQETEKGLMTTPASLFSNSRVRLAQISAENAIIREIDLTEFLESGSTQQLGEEYVIVAPARVDIWAPLLPPSSSLSLIVLNYKCIYLVFGCVEEVARDGRRVEEESCHLVCSRPISSAKKFHH